MRQHGHAPVAHLFGKQPKLEACMLDEQRRLESFEIEREGEPGFATKTRALAADLPKNAA